jgi:hypothetical protein
MDSERQKKISALVQDNKIRDAKKQVYEWTKTNVICFREFLDYFRQIEVAEIYGSPEKLTK